MDEERFLDVSQVARRLKVCEETVRSGIRAGKIPVIDISTTGKSPRYRIPESYLVARVRCPEEGLADRLNHR